MNGKISILGTATSPGIIKADNGLSVPFNRSAAIAYSGNALALNQPVSFEIQNGSTPMAIEVRVRKDEEPVILRRDLASHQSAFRYMGFDQIGASRGYKFDEVGSGKDAVRHVVKVAMDLFAKHHIGIQDGPALCLHAIAARPFTQAAADAESLQSLTDADLRGYEDSKVLAAAKSHRVRPVRVRTAVAEQQQ